MWERERHRLRGSVRVSRGLVAAGRAPAPTTPELSRAVGVGLNELLCGLVDERED